MSATAPASSPPEPFARHRSFPVLAAALALLAPCGAPLPARAADWPPVAAADRALAAVDPAGPGAIILFEEADVDDRDPGRRLQTIYRRIKVLANPGLTWATLTIRLAEPEQSLIDLEGRTVKPDGREEPLNRSDLSRSTAADGFTELTFRLPAVEVGDIIEYRYALLGGSPPPLGGWIFQHEVPCRRSTFTWRPSLLATSRWVLLGAESFDPVVEPLFRPNAPDSLEAARFELVDLPAAVEEPWGPPLIECRARVVTTYTAGATSPPPYWGAFTAAGRAREDEFCARSGALVAALEAFRPASTDAEATIRRAYDFVQSRLRTVAGGAAPGAAVTADSLLALGEAGADGINLMFIAALRAAGITATRAFVVDRDRAFFHADVLSPAQFHRSLVAVQPGPGRVFFFAPGIPGAPAGILPWYSQAVTAVVAGDSSALFLPTPIDPPEVNRITRSFDGRMDEKGRLTGRVRVELAGQPELEARQVLAAGGRSALAEQLLAEWGVSVPGLKIDSLGTVNHESIEKNLEFRAVVSAPAYARKVDLEVLVNAAVLARQARNPLGSVEDTRRLPVFVRYPQAVADYVTLSLPREWRVEGLPRPVSFGNEYGSYEGRWSWDGERLQYQRTLVVAAARVEPARVATLFRLFEEVRAGDGTLVTLAFRPLPPSQR